MNIFIEIKDSVYNPTYYQSVISDRSFRSSMKYLAKVILLISLVMTLIFIVSIPIFSKTIKEGITSGIASYPDDLVLSIKGGTASINKPEPYMMRLPQAWIDSQSTKSPKIENFVTINTKDPFNSNTFYSYNSLVLITKNEIVNRKDSNGSIQITPLSKVSNIDITKVFLLGKQTQLLKILPILYVVLPILLYIVSFIGIFIGTMFMVLIYALVILIVAKIKKLDLSYKKSYQVGMHLVTLLLFIGLLSTFIGFPNSFLLKIILIGLLAYANFNEMSKPEVIA